MTELLINPKEIVNDDKFLPPDDSWHSQQSSPSKYNFLLFFILVAQAVCFGFCVSLYSSSALLYTFSPVALTNCLTMLAVIMSFIVSVCVICHFEWVIILYDKQKFFANLIGCAPIALYLAMVVLIFCYTSLGDIDVNTYKCLFVEFVLCIACVIARYILRDLMTALGDNSTIRSFHSSSVIGMYT
eukprot:TRINITY_DN1204_c0_g1_i16.p2 TRINITY_DN1204_c0_g1~~TRINITY_DN1204_c0_g1_i16.p2  ORF type:complete len:186 (-),score=23.47 TRINITY_DN1204_c0_g1_i16:143-700(-)